MRSRGTARSASPRRKIDQEESARPSERNAERRRILIEGRNCWRIAAAGRAAFLVDGADYFEAFASAVEKARESILILGWDIDSRIDVLRDRPGHELPGELGNFLDAVVSRRRGLQAHILAWNFNFIYTLEREPIPLAKMRWRTHPRLHFQVDGNHPAWASLHQKVVVLDDAVAFVGGLDLTRSRWDTQEHRPADPRRIDPRGATYGPFHDVQMVVDGEAAAVLGDLARERWRRATGERLTPPRIWGRNPWPDGLEADLEDIHVGVARTEPSFKGFPGIREVEALNLDAIAAARSSIYIENPYLSSEAVGRALISRLRQEDGPEILIVLPKTASGGLEETTMDVARARLLRRLRQADPFGRLRIYYPVLEGSRDEGLNVHSKVIIVDDELVRVGSSNLTNRSMGLDAECDLAVEAEENPRLKARIAGFRDRLLAEHLGTDPGKVSEAIAAEGSMIKGVEALRGGARTLDLLKEELAEWQDQLIPDSSIVDPEQPIAPETVLRDFVPEDIREPVRSHLLPWAILFAAVLALGGAWKWTPLGNLLTADSIAELANRIDEFRAAPLLVIGAYVVGGLVAVPVTLLIAATAFLFGPWAGFAYSLTGCFLSAMAAYGIGRLMGRRLVGRLAGRRLYRLSRLLRRRGLVAVATVRMVPVAPFTFVNLAAGAFRIRLLDFALGTVIGMGPGLMAISFFGERLAHAVRHPGPGSFLVLAAVAALIVGAAEWVRRRLKDRESVEPKGASEGRV